tara:strand:- start:12799 stop:14094 length:1296 start_codon:yes stop_codon:yes gene_type:complete
MLTKTFVNKEVLIYGLGISGNSCLRFLQKKNNVKVFDDNFLLKNKKFKKFFLDKNKIFKLKFDYIVLSPGIDIKKCKLKKYLLKNKKKIITELDIFYLSYPENKKITITGTNGKSSTCQMLYNIFKLNKLDVRLVGNIGNSPLSELKIKKKTIFIIEASSYQISYSKYFKTDYAIILNLSVDHLERHNSLNKYAQAKIKLIYDQKKNKLSFIERDSIIINKYLLKNETKSKVIRIIYDKDSFFRKKIKNNYILDKNNLNNIHFVYAISKKFKILNNKIFKSLNLFKGLKFRKQIIYDKPNLKIINDSKSTSFSSTNGLLSSYNNIYWIVGGMFKKGDKFTLEKKYYKNIKAYIIGSNRKYFVNQFKNKIKFKYLKYLNKAIIAISEEFKKDKKKKTILFSPAAASFDQYKNFEDRGNYFNLLIKKSGIYGK